MARSGEFWKKIELLRRQLISLRSSGLNNAPHYHSSETRSLDVLTEIEDITGDVIKSICEGKSPVLRLVNRETWENVSYTSDAGIHMVEESPLTNVSYTNTSSAKKIAILLHLMSKIFKLVQTNTYSTKRDIYYQDVQLYGSQKIVDIAVDDIACLLRVPRRKLHILATSKGLIAGDLQFKDSDGNYVDCTTSITGISIPTDVHGIQYMTSDARFVLIVEKDATFQKLMNAGFLTEFKPSILITGKGFPDVNTREMVKKIYDVLQIPIFALVDADPYGIEILCIYKYGSRALSFDAHNLVTRNIQWIGIHPTDMQRLQIPESALLQMTKSDVRKASNLLLRPYIQNNKSWREQIEFLLKVQKKAEIQSLCSIAPNFLQEIHLPSKMRLGGWL